MRTAPDTQQHPRIFYGWYIVAASFTCNVFTSGAYWQGFQVFFLPILRDFGWSRAALSGAFSLRQVETGAFAPFLGFIVDRIGPKPVIMTGGFVLGLGMVMLSYTFSIWSFYVFFLVASLGASGTSHAIGWTVVIARWFRRLRGTALGIGMSGPILTGAVLFVLALLVEEVGWRWTLRGTGVALIFIIVPLALVIRGSPQAYGVLPDGDLPRRPREGTLTQGDIEADRRARHDRNAVPDDDQGASAGEALRSRSFWIVSLLFGAMFFGTSALQVHQVPLFESKGFSTAEAAVTVTLVFLVSGVGRIGAGSLADLLEIRYVLAMMVVLQAVSWLYLTLFGTTSLWASVPFTVLYGVSFGAMVSVRPVLLAQLFGTRALGSLSGMLQATALASGTIGPVFMGWVFDRNQEYDVAMIAFIATSAAAFPLAWAIRPVGSLAERRRRARRLGARMRGSA